MKLWYFRNRILNEFEPNLNLSESGVSSSDESQSESDQGASTSKRIVPNIQISWMEAIKKWVVHGDIELPDVPPPPEISAFRRINIVIGPNSNYVQMEVIPIVLAFVTA